VLEDGTAVLLNEVLAVVDALVGGGHGSTAARHTQERRACPIGVHAEIEDLTAALVYGRGIDGGWQVMDQLGAFARTSNGEGLSPSIAVSGDMLFVAADGTVRDIHVNATPLDETPIPSATDDIFAVLEVNGGLAEMLGLTPGAQLRHPAFETNPVWPCD
jgi:hypothetical protein